MTVTGLPALNAIAAVAAAPPGLRTSADYPCAASPRFKT
jgi:4-hydroxy-tetrahydrodipicolinate reductase